MVMELSSSANPSTLGQPVTFTATVTPVGGSGFAPVGLRSAVRPRQVAEDGSLTISDGDTVLAVVPLEGGQAAFTTSSLSTGAHTITAAFSGTATAAPSSATLIQQVNQAATLPATR
jgi:Bacterial Ig-like domain (group 3)